MKSKKNKTDQDRLSAKWLLISGSVAAVFLAAGILVFTMLHSVELDGEYTHWMDWMFSAEATPGNPPGYCIAKTSGGGFLASLDGRMICFREAEDARQYLISKRTQSNEWKQRHQSPRGDGQD